MAGKPLSQFADFVTATYQYNLKAQNDSGILAEAVNQTYLTGALLKGKKASQVIKSGKDIRSYSQFSTGSQTGFYLPGDTFNTSIEDLDTTITQYFRYLHDAFAYTKQEIEQNMPGTDDFNTQQRIFDLIKNKRQGCRVSTYNTIESAWWTTPAIATMDTAATANRPYSIRCYITEDGLAPSGFTTVAGVNPSTQSKWRNQVSNYTAGSIDTTLKPAFADMWRKVGFMSPPMMQQYISDTNFSRFLILTDINGAKKYQQLTEEANDRLVGDGKDLGVYAGDLPYNGIPVKYIKEMDGLGYATTQPRFFWINTDYLFPVWHSSAYFAEEEPMRAVNQPYVWVVHVDTWYQLICTSRQRLGIVCPG